MAKEPPVDGDQQQKDILLVKDDEPFQLASKADGKYIPAVSFLITEARVEDTRTILSVSVEVDEGTELMLSTVRRQPKG